MDGTKPSPTAKKRVKLVGAGNKDGGTTADPIKESQSESRSSEGRGGGEGGSTTTNSTKTKKKSKQWPLKRKPPSGNTKESETRQHHQ